VIITTPKPKPSAKPSLQTWFVLEAARSEARRGEVGEDAGEHRTPLRQGGRARGCLASDGVTVAAHHASAGLGGEGLVDVGPAGGGYE
jgi:hypothetical protein